MAWPKKFKIKNLVGARVRQVRLGRQPALSQVDLAAMLGDALSRPNFDRATVARIESGVREVTDVELVAIAQVLGVTIDWLLFGDPEEPG